MMADGASEIFTIGHSNHSIEQFVALLEMHRISVLADVRSAPYSRMYPQFNREVLQELLDRSGIRYAFMGAELGARRDEPECYVEEKARYDLIARTPRFREGLERLHRSAGRHRVALVCAEQDPLTCHRAILVCRHLRTAFSISHILDDGRLECHAALEERLLKATRIEGADLFTTAEDALERAYDVQGDRIAYVRPPALIEQGGNGWR